MPRPSEPRLPQGARRLLQRLLHPADRAPALADLEEEFEERWRRDGRRAARRWYWAQALRSVGPTVGRRWPAARTVGGSLPNEWRWAWRGVRARRGAGLLTVGLLAVALGANTVLFSVADSLILRRFPYSDRNRLVGFMVDLGGDRVAKWSVSTAEFDYLRGRTDLFASVHGYSTGSIAFVLGGDQPQDVRYTFVTPGLVDSLGAVPRWGRTLTERDALDTETSVALITEELARERFGNPAAAVGAKLATSGRPLTVVGVMSKGFRFPDNRQQIWRPLDIPRLAQGGRDRADVIARLAAGVTPAQLSAALTTFPPAIFEESVRDGGRVRAADPLFDMFGRTQRQLLLLLIAAAACLLAIAVANVVSLELSGSTTRIHGNAIRTALGASRAGLVRVAALEGGCLIGASLLVAAGLSWGALDTVARWLPVRLTLSSSANPVDLDGHALLFMVLVALVVWVVVSVPLAIVASNRRLLDVLRIEQRTSAASRGRTLLRRGLTVAQIGLAIVLLIGSTLFVRSYAALLRIDKGFDSTGVARLSVTIPPSSYATGGATSALRDEILARLRARPDVVAVTASAPLDTNNSTGPHLEVDGRGPVTGEVWLSERTVDTAFFATLGISLRQGRLFDPSDGRDAVVITEALGSRLWPGENPLGQRFRAGAKAQWSTVVGVVARPRDTSFRPDSPGREHFPVYLPAAVASPRPASVVFTPPADAPVVHRPNVPAPGPIFRSMGFLVRLDPPTRLDEVTQAVRSIDSRFRLTTEWIDETYAATFDDRALAARVVTAFGVLAFIVAVAGVYGVMTLLVSGRTREIGIRMALGADRRDIRRLVLASSIRLSAAGAILGLVGAFAASKGIQSQLFGVSPTDPATYLTVVLAVLMAALAAAWPPARRAARVDPTVALRAE